MRRPFLLLLCILVTLIGIGQSELYEEPVIIYSHQLSGGLHAHSNGWGGTMSLGKYKEAHKIWLYSLDMLHMKHEKEIKSFNPVYDNSKSYVYGKLNSFFIVRPGIGQKKILTDKLRTSGVQVGYSWGIGVSAGFSKPVYLEIGYPSIPYDYLAVERYDPDRHYFDDIYGRASGLNGLEELRVHPGGFAKFALNFEYSSEKDRLKGLEVGGVLDVYPERIPIMAENVGELEGIRNKNIFFNFYINLFIGKKYNKR
ncbi:MAG: hypothetical protein HKN32_01580 [Flavobacteriales bacterium]|nr:hypothetical protein [Flavobacteriales bacterium]